MKGLLLRWISAVILTLFIFPLTACTGSSNDVTTVRIGVALYKQDDTFITLVAQELEKFAMEKEAELGIKINLYIADGNGSQSAQNEQIDRFLDRGYDIICVNVVDRTAAAVLIDKAHNAGVPIIFFNREPVEEDMARWSQAYYVGSDGGLSGTLQGQIILDAIEDGAVIDKNGDGVLQYVMLEGEPGHQDALLRTENSVRILTSSGIAVEKLAGDSANWQRSQALEKMRAWLKEMSDSIEVVIANNDDMALGAIDACVEFGIDVSEMPFIVGVDATPPALSALQDGTLKGTVLNDAKGQAHAMINLSCALALGERPASSVDLTDGNYIWLPYLTVTLKNIEDFLSDA
ncbi:MAG: galactose ABC transporter substrate-binding protein [Clostridia bacterium]|nr:galactose ABC transporter substrate-binding protein [Clostridia bacterium]